MKNLSTMLLARRHPQAKTLRAIAILVAGILLSAPLAGASATHSRALARYENYSPGERWAGGCGYDPRGAEDEWHNHKLNQLRMKDRPLDNQAAALSATVERKSAATIEDRDDVALVEDDGTIVMPPSKFDLKNRSLLFTPEGDGYRVTRGDLDFISKRDFSLNYFFGAGNVLGNSNNGYRDLQLRVAPFTFFGITYNMVYVGTNGYITFQEGDTGARPSAAALAYELPRISPLWADLDLTNSGAVYYARLADHHVITWQSVPQAQYSGASTFQAVLYDDGRIAFVYKKVKARASLLGISPGRSERDAQPIDFSDPPAEPITGSFFESFAQEKRIDLPALTRAFYSAYPDVFDMIYVWTDFQFDNGLGVARAFNLRNDIEGIGLDIFDRGRGYGSHARLSSLFAMGDIARDWPSDPHAHVVGLNSAVSIVCHEQGHRWLAYVLFDAEHDIKDDLLGREQAHWSFLADTRTTESGNFSSLMEGNAWRDNGNGTFTTIESAVNHYSKLDQYLMGLRAADEVGTITYLSVEDQFKELVRSKSPVSGFSMTARRKTTSVEQIIEREGPRVPSVSDAQKEFRIAFILLSERGSRPSSATVDKTARYREALVRYFSTATERRGSLNSSLSAEGGSD